MRTIQSKVPVIPVPDNDNFCNVAAEIQDGKLLIHILAADRYILQIEIGEKPVYRVLSSHYNYSGSIYEYTYLPSLLFWEIEEWPVRILGDSQKIIEDYTGIKLQENIIISLDLLKIKYEKGEKAYQKKVRDHEERERLFELLPDEPEDIVDYANKGPLSFSSYLISSPNLYIKSKRDFYCTNCYYQYTDYPMARGRMVTCPNCGRDVEVKYARYFHPCDRSEFVVFQLAKDGRGIFARYYLCKRDYTTYMNVITELCELGRYYFAPGISRLWTRSRTCQSTQNQYFTNSKAWYKRGMFFFYCENFYGGVSDIRDKLLKVFPHCQWDLYRNRFLKYRISFGCIASYIVKYSRSPQLEYFLKLELNQFVQEYVGESICYSRINWRGKKLETIFGLPKEIIKTYIFTHKIEDSAVLEYAKTIFKVGKFSEENLNLMLNMRKNIGDYSWNQFFSQFRKSDIIEVMKYLLAQQRKEARYTGKEPDFYFLSTQYKDYLNMAEKVQYNLDSDYFRYPKYLKKAHDDVQKLIKIKADMELEKKVRKQARKLQKYYFEYNGLFIRPFQSAKEITKEGRTQNICISIYIDKYANGETGLFCIRKKSNPGKPFYAMELKNRQIIQVRGNSNQEATPEVDEFVKAFKAECLKLVENRMQVAI